MSLYTPCERCHNPYPSPCTCPAPPTAPVVGRIEQLTSEPSRPMACGHTGSIGVCADCISRVSEPRAAEEAIGGCRHRMFRMAHPCPQCRELDALAEKLKEAEAHVEFHDAVVKQRNDARRERDEAIRQRDAWKDHELAVMQGHVEVLREALEKIEDDDRYDCPHAATARSSTSNLPAAAKARMEEWEQVRRERDQFEEERRAALDDYNDAIRDRALLLAIAEAAEEAGRKVLIQPPGTVQIDILKWGPVMDAVAAWKAREGEGG